MPHLFTCPHCQTMTQVDDRYSGHAGQCLSCGGEIQMPNFLDTEGAGGALPYRDERSKKSIWFVGAGVTVVLTGCLLFAMIRVGGQTMGQMQQSRVRSASMRNLERIASAMNAYAADHGAYPPAATKDANGQPLHSWRVLILPYLGEEELFNEFDLKLPWSHPENMQVAYDIPAVYKHPAGSANTMFSQSAYYVIVGQGTLFPVATAPLGPERITDDVSQTILVIEGTPIVASGLWTEPVDLDITKITGKIGSNPGTEPGGHFEDGVAMATADGRGHFVPDTMDPIVFRSLITPRGDERLADDTLD